MNTSKIPHALDPQSLALVLYAFAALVADEIVRRQAAPAPSRVPLTDEGARAAGVPSARWIREKARLGLIVIRGPRGAQYVDAAELSTLLGSTAVRRRRRAVPPSDGSDVADDARAAVADLAARRCAR